MLHTLLTPRLLILATFLASVTFVQFRGRVRHKFSRLVADHANLLAPYNSLMYLFSAVKAKPYADVREFPELRQVTEQWQMIREEALKLFDEGHIRAASGYNDIGFNTFFKRGWKRFYLKWYGDFLPSASALCPKTAELLAKIPSINAAMFTLLPPGSRLELGSAVIEVSAEPHTGCGQFVQRFGVEAMKFVNSPLGRQLHLRGINARVIRAGTVRVGDRARKLT